MKLSRKLILLKLIAVFTFYPAIALIWWFSWKLGLAFTLIFVSCNIILPKVHALKLETEDEEK
jgi:hypothetical protein